ncbi:MAG: Ig-like domain-containing protein [Thiolinea sp.]
MQTPNAHRLTRTIALILLTGSLASFSAHAAKPAVNPLNGELPPGLQQLPPGLLKQQIKDLPAAAQANALKWLNSINFSDQDVPYMRADKNGGIFFVDSYLPTGTLDEMPVIEPATVVGVNDVFALHSKPGATNVIYLDFDGHVITNTAWNSEFSTLNALPYDLDNNPGDFNSTEVAYMAEIWRRIAEDYAPFDVDVTTEKPVAMNATTGRLLITRNVDANGNNMPAVSAGGVAYVGVWGASYYPNYSPALVYYNNLGGGRPDYVAEAATHEMGHNMGLSHDATNTSSYYGGHGTGNISWGPLMGTGYGRNVSQWSRGEYTGANQFEDDIQIITSKVGLRADDHGNMMTQATPLLVDADGTVMSTTLADDPYMLDLANKGLISTRDDVDVFSFATTGGVVDLQASPALEASFTRGGNLDIELALYDQQGNLLASDNPADDTVAGITHNVGAGTFYIAVSGSGSVNYSDYGSLGRFSLQGSVPVSTDSNPPAPNPMGWSVVPMAVDHQSMQMTAVTAVDDTSGVEYFFNCTAGGNGCQDSGWISSPQYSLSGLDAETSYTFRVKARDSFGNETAYSAEASATTEAAPVVNQPPVAADDLAEVLIGGSVNISVLDNDSDPESDVLTIVAVSQGGKGSVSTDGTTITYQAGSKRGGDSFSYTVADSQGNTASAIVNVSIVRSLSDGSTGGDTGGNTGGGGKGRKK